jgi:carboxyl-terminal processing protease
MKPFVLRGLLAVLLGIGLGLAASVAPGVLADKRPAAEELPWEEARLLAEVLERVKRDYVDRVDDRELVEAAIRGMIADLDPHSAFLDPLEYREVRLSTSGRYSGIGVEIAVHDDRIVVVAPIDGSPAARAGIEAGDIVFSIDGLAVSGADLKDTIARMRGEAGTPVVLGIRRPGVEEAMSVELERGEIDVQSVRGEVLPDGSAYIRISHFTDGTARELRAVISELERRSEAPLPGLVLDLRNNPGGVLDAAIQVADAFLEKGLIVSAEGRIAEARFRAAATPGDLLAAAPMSVLVNRGSASAAEIVAGALKDHGRATLVGDATFGKGSVQTIIPLSDGHAIKLTTSRYYTPSGASIHARGIAPDIAIAAAGDAGDAQLDAAVLALSRPRSVARAGLAAAGRFGD